MELAKAGIGYICPHLNSAWFETLVPEVPPAFYYEMGLLQLEACDAILMLEGWEESKGAKVEHGFAEDWDIPIFYDIPAAIKWVAEEAKQPRSIYTRLQDFI